MTRVLSFILGGGGRFEPAYVDPSTVERVYAVDAQDVNLVDVGAGAHFDRLMDSVEPDDFADVCPICGEQSCPRHKAILVGLVR